MTPAAHLAAESPPHLDESDRDGSAPDVRRLSSLLEISRSPGL